MPVSHGHKLKRMTTSKEFFKLEEPFLYTPLADQSVQIVITPVPMPRNMNYGEVCRYRCSLSKWCCTENNYTDNGEHYIPDCHQESREDNTAVYFKEVCKLCQ